MDLRPGMRVLDLCAAPGGKSTHIAEILGGDGSVTACDVTAAKVARIEENARRLGLSGIRPVLIDPADDAPLAGERFDRILVDAPCSNSGVFRRRPEARDRLGPEALASLQTAQIGLLRRAAPLLVPGGSLLYSTCSIEPEECRDAVGAFLDAIPGYHLEGDVLGPPTVGGPDGGYLARIEGEGA